VNPYLAVVIGVVCAGLGGELFVRGTMNLAQWARISPGIVAVTVAAFATSSPELSVSITSALSGTPQIAMGDALGSNVVNVALILGGALLVAGIRSPRSGVKRDFPITLAVPLLTSSLVIDGVLSRLDGVLMLAIFIGWIVLTIRDARRERSAAAELATHQGLVRAVAFCVAGLAVLLTAAHFIVLGARGLALSFGISEFVVGATVVAIGTSVPELATTLIAKLRSHDEIGLGTILGSNIFNGLFIVGVAATIHPIAIAPASVAVALGFGIAAVVCSLPGRDGWIGRRRGILLVALYCVYVTAVLLGPS